MNFCSTFLNKRRISFELSSDNIWLIKQCLVFFLEIMKSTYRSFF